MLMWHYRSQHQSLIAVSNSEYYDNRLFVVPSPIRESRDFGVKFSFVPEGIYERGRSTTNPVEARTVAEHVIEHARKHPDRSLGVGTFSLKQRDAIQDEIELLQRDNPELLRFFEQCGAERFFVKNLETIQGDERDVIFISVGYGKDADGYMTQSYGPLNRDGGERRLNVLISRAKQKCMVFSSITADDIDLNRAKARGVVGLKKFLQFAEHGYSDVGEITGKDHDSEFERAVANAIAGYGHTIEAQVGVAGFFIDLAVVDPNQPGRYLLGIECDGAAYHSSRSARDRDRLREEVLRARGWQIHRIWSTDWYQQPKSELRKVLKAIELAQRGELQPESLPVPTAVSSTPEGSSDEQVMTPPQATVDADSSGADQTDDHPYGIPVVPYEESASARLPGVSSVLEIPESVLDSAICLIVAQEGPIHCKEIARRLASFVGGRAVSRVNQTVRAGVARLEKRGDVKVDQEFVFDSDPSDLVVRDRSNVSSSSLRDPENIPPQEISLALTLLIQANGNAETDELVRAVAIVMGFKQAGAKFKRAAHAVIDELVGAGELIDREGVLSIGDRDRSEVPDAHVQR